MKRPVGIIAFDRHSSLDQGLVFMMNADGSNAHQLAAGWHLDFRPDGTRVAFEETKSIGDRVIYEVDLTGLVVDLSTSPYDYRANCISPA